jgi:CRP-like cAMP-binding protein
LVHRTKESCLAPDPQKITNRLLDRLPEKDRARVLAACERVELARGPLLDAAGALIQHVYFPTSCFSSLLTTVRGGTLEVSLAGNEGFYGVPLACGARTSPARAVVHASGSAWRMEPEAFRRELAALPSLRRCVDHYLFAVLGQLMRRAGCNRFHVVEQRLARRLLMLADRSHSATFAITHEALANTLGVRRVGVTEAAGALQKRGLIAYVRGRVTILARRGLERAACGCYRADLDAYDSAFA